MGNNALHAISLQRFIARESRSAGVQPNVAYQPAFRDYEFQVAGIHCLTAMGFSALQHEIGRSDARWLSDQHAQWLVPA